MNERISALEVAIGFTYGVYDRDFVVDWVTSQVVASDRVDGPLLELCTLAHLRDDEVARQLHALASEEPAPAPAVQLKLACLGVMVEANRTELDAAITHLYFLGADEEFTEDERATMHQLEYGHDLAVWGEYGTLEQVRADLLAFTSRYRHLLAGVR